MAKGAAREDKLGLLHSTLSRVFIKVLEKYEMQLAVIDKFNERDEAGDFVADEFMAAAILELGDPNPAMLSAISKFLKDNEIMYDSEEIDQLSSTQRRLAEMKKKRGNVVTLDNIPLAEEA
jgi:acetylornithine/succinyldiaminopimelate/putrescine aminotransferase